MALANEMVGGAQWLLESAVEYATLRSQFGRPIGSFQAIKHKCSDLLLEVELAKSAAYYAADAAAENDSELPVLACIAKSAAADAYMHAARDCIQIHGGIGFTWDKRHPPLVQARQELRSAVRHTIPAPGAHDVAYRR